MRRLRISGIGNFLSPTPFKGSRENKESSVHSNSMESASSSSSSALPRDTFDKEEIDGDSDSSIYEENDALSESLSNITYRSSRIHRSPKWGHIGGGSHKRGTIADLHPNGPFSIYFTHQLDQCPYVSLLSPIVKQKRPSLFTPILQNASRLGICFRCYICCGNSSCVPYTPLDQSVHHVIMSSSELVPSSHHVDITLILAATYFLNSLFPIVLIVFSFFATSSNAGKGFLSLLLSSSDP